MHREIIINFILEKLASLITYVRLKSSCNLHDANIHSENFLLLFLINYLIKILEMRMFWVLILEELI